MKYLLTSKSTLSPSGIFGALGLKGMKAMCFNGILGISVFPSSSVKLKGCCIASQHWNWLLSYKKCLVDNSTYLNLGLSSVMKKSKRERDM